MIKQFFILSLVSLISCTNSQTEECGNSINYTEMGYEIIDTLRLSVANLQYNHSATFLTEADGKIIFGGYDSYNHRIDRFVLDETNSLSHIFLKRGGEENSIDSEISSILYVNKDSIFLAESSYNEIYLVNDNGKKIDSWSFFEFETDLDGENFTGYYGLGAISKYGMNLFMKDKNTLLTHFSPVATDDGRMFSTFFSLPPVATLDLSQKEVKKHIGEFPDEYKNEKIPQNPFVSYCVDSGGEIVVLFPQSSKLYSTKSNDFSCIFSKFYAPGESELKSKSEEINPDEFYQNLEKDGAFTNILYDKYRNVFYVIAKHGVPLPDYQGYYDGSLSSWSIIKLDRNLNIMGETKMIKGKYDYSSVFVIPEGILVSLENPYNPENVEDFLDFEIISL